MQIQTHISINVKQFPQEAKMLLELKSERKLNKAFLLFLQEQKRLKKQMELL